MATVIDTAGGFPSAQAIRAAGHTGIMVYVSPSRPGSNFAGKPITGSVLPGYLAAGLPVAANWQYGKPGNAAAPSDWTTGYDGGRRMARQALDNWFAAGGPGWTPIYFSVDEDIGLAGWNSTAVHYFRGCCDEIGRDWVGIYGHSRVIAWAAEDQVIGRAPGGRWWAWQTRAWSNGEFAPEAVLYQNVIDTPTSPGPQVGGITVDVNDIWADDWGHTGIDRSPETAGGSPVIDYGITDTLFGYNLASIGTGNSNGVRPRTDYAVVHTQEGGRGDAIELANYCNNSLAVAYNIEVDDQRTVLNVPVDEGPWAAAEANDIAVHLCFAGSYAAWGPERWLSTDASDGLDENAMLWRGARAVAAACTEFGIDTVFAGDGGVSGWPPRGNGICGHRDFGVRGGGHTDPGNGFPMDVFLDRVRSFSAPVVNLIDAAADRASAWIGARISEGENTAPDGAGRWAEFEHAHIYWCPPANQAYPVPHADPAIPGGGLFETWGTDYRWETGPLGYPILDHAVVDGGAVQAFHGGTLLRRNGTDRGFYVHGAIGARYAEMGWEQGALGWPVSDEERVDNAGTLGQRFDHGILRWSPTGVIADLDDDR